MKKSPSWKHFTRTHKLFKQINLFLSVCIALSLLTEVSAQPLYIAGSSTYYNELVGGSASPFGRILTQQTRTNNSVGVKTCLGKAAGTGWFKFTQSDNSWTSQWGGSTVTTLSTNTYYSLGAVYGGSSNLQATIAAGSYYTFIIGQNSSSSNNIAVLLSAETPASVSSVTTTTPAQNTATTITANLGSAISTTSGEGAQYVYLAYSVNSGSYTTVAMTRSSSTDRKSVV